MMCKLSKDSRGNAEELCQEPELRKENCKSQNVDHMEDKVTCECFELELVVVAAY